MSHFSVESAPHTFVTTPGVGAGPAMTEYVQPAPVAEYVTEVPAAPAVTYEALAGHPNFREFGNCSRLTRRACGVGGHGGIGPPSSASCTLLVFVTGPMVKAALVVAECVQLALGDIITDNLTNEEFAQALDTAISQYLGHLKSMNARVSSLELTPEVARSKLDYWAFNKQT